MRFNSCLYTGETIHQRTWPKSYRFRYKLFYFYLDLDELELLDRKLKFFSLEKFGLYEFRESDHDLREKKTLKESISHLVHQRSYVDTENGESVGKIYLLTTLRNLKFIFNPVCFYFVEIMRGETKARTILVAEVMNTFYEIKSYTLKSERDEIGQEIFRGKQNKDFYISPFSSPKGEIGFRLDIPQEEFNFLIENYQDGRHSLSATLSGQRAELTDKKLLSLFLRHPMLGVKVWAAIHLRALHLFIKRLPFFKKSQLKEHQKGFVLWKNQKR